jgi:eukaryotic-like serine/threonine-protein kinase
MKPEQWERTQQLYHAALERDAQERAAWLEHACADDAALRREVESLLAASAEVGDFLLSPALRVEARALAAEQQLSAVGQQLNQYQLVSRLGAGGMGEVYLAHDSKLQRKVALKLLHARFTQDAEQVRRFAREAKAVSALNHPNIITVHETGEVGATRFIAAEFIEGVTLRQRLTEGRIELREALETALQVAAALAAAHQAGIVHRDIKPENIMLRPDGLVKVLDFGLARLTEPQLLAEEGQTAHSTESGAVVGTPRYMAPEQAQGQKVDALADIFSLGVVLYEMITRRLPFDGATTAEVFVALLTKEPEPLAQHAPGVPAGLERIISRALARERAARYQSVQELRADLQAQLASLQQVGGQSWPSLRWRFKRLAWSVRWFAWRRWRVITASLLAMLLVVGIAWWFKWRVTLSNEASPPATANPRIAELFSVPMANEGENLDGLKFSPDGKWLIYNVIKPNESHLWLKQVEGGEPKQLTAGKVEDKSPLWSPDGQELAFASNRGGAPGIWTMPAQGGTPKLLSRFAFESESVALTNWSRNGQTIYCIRNYLSKNSNLYKFDLATKQSSAVTHFKDSEGIYFSVSPDEKQIAYATYKNGFRIFVMPLGGGEAREVSQGGGNGVGDISWFPDGKRVSYIFDQLDAPDGIYLAWLDGRAPLWLTFTDEGYICQTVSPDGTKIASASDKINANLFACELRTGAEIALTSGVNIRLVPELSPDSETIVFQANPSLTVWDFSLFLQPRAPGSYAHQFISNGTWAKWSPVEDKLVFLRRVNNEQYQYDLWQVSRRGGDEQRLTTGVVAGTLGVMPFSPQGTWYDWSPDGKQLAYGSKKSGQANVWVVASDGTSDVMLSHNTDPKLTITSPVWSPDGKRIAYATRLGEPYGPRLSEKRSISVIEPGKTATVYDSEQELFTIGWSASGQEILVLQGKYIQFQPLKAMSLVSVPLSGGQPRVILHRPNDYLHNASLSHDRRFLALASKREGIDNIEIIPVSGGPVRNLTRNSDPSIFYSGLAWAPDGKTLFYSKQTGWTQVSLIEDFK